MDLETTDSSESIGKTYKECILSRYTGNSTVDGHLVKVTVFRFFTLFGKEQILQFLRSVKAKGYKLDRWRLSDGRFYITVADFAT